jgi:hypothetical protein
MTTVAAPTKFQQLKLKASTPSAAPMPILAGADGRATNAILGSQGPIIAGGPAIETQAFCFSAAGAQTLTPQHLANGLIIVPAAATFTTPTAAQILSFFSPQETMPGTAATIYSYMSTTGGVPSTAKTLSAGLPLLVPCLHLRIWQTGNAQATQITCAANVFFQGTSATGIPIVGTDCAALGNWVATSAATGTKYDVFFYVIDSNPAAPKIGFVAM